MLESRRYSVAKKRGSKPIKPCKDQMIEGKNEKYESNTEK